MPRSQSWLLLSLAVALLSLHAGCAASPEEKTSPGGLNYLIMNGVPDYKNRYSSAVQVMAGSRGACSGVLASPHLVFTAAHCLCFPSEVVPSHAYRYKGKGGAPSRNEVKLTCAETAEVVATLYAHEDDAQGGDTVSFTLPSTQSRQGTVRIHEGYDFFTDDAGNVAASSMDLAAIHLDKPLEGLRVDGKLAQREVQLEEVLTVVGYGVAPRGRGGIRHFGMNKVMDIATSVGGDGLFSFRGAGEKSQGAHAWRGDSGGPCFREDGAGNRWLAGIISTGQITRGGTVTHFTSVFHHRAWIKAQMDLSREKGRAHAKELTR